MSLLDPKYCLNTYDIKPVVDELKNYSFKKILIDNVHTCYSLYSRDTTLLLRECERKLIDDFLKYTINSFQIYSINLYNPRNNSIAELQFFEDQFKAKSYLYDILNTTQITDSGNDVVFSRTDNTMYLLKPIH